MKAKKEFPATHSMSTEWFVADQDGNIALFDFNEEGPVPEQIMGGEGGWLEDISAPDEDGINSLELTDEQAADMLSVLSQFHLCQRTMNTIALFN